MPPSALELLDPALNVLEEGMKSRNANTRWCSNELYSLNTHATKCMYIYTYSTFTFSPGDLRARRLNAWYAYDP